MRDEILAMIARCQNRIRGLQAETDPTAVGQCAAYCRVLEDLKRLLKLTQNRGGETMKYIVTVIQNIKYTDRIKGKFTNLAVVQQFVEMVSKHFEKVSISIDVVTEDEQEEDE